MLKLFLISHIIINIEIIIIWRLIMDLRSKISKILNDFQQAKKSEFKENSLAHFANKGLNDVFDKDFFPNNYETHGSAGNGRWATIPWIGVFDTNINTSPQKGFDIVYLFSIRSNYVYLSLNQGWTFYRDNYSSKDAQRNIKLVSEHLLSELSVPSSKMVTSSIDLLEGTDVKNTTLPRGYELSNILSIKYDKNNLPSNETMVADLHDMITVLGQVKDQLIFPTLERNIEYFISKHNDDYTQIGSTDYSDEPSEINDSATESKRKFTGRKIDYKSLNNQKESIGAEGENIVMKFERKKLSNYPNLLSKIEHTSQVSGDGTGYDIKSYNTHGDPLFIEVKTTTGNKSTPFFITTNELEASKILGKNYMVFRIYNFSKNTNINNLKYYLISGSLENNPEIELAPSQYTVRIK